VHYSKNTQRRQDLEADPGLKVFSKVTWIDWYDKEDLICPWVKEITKTPISLGLVSTSMKHYEAFRLIVERGLESAFVFEDDVVFREDWYEKFRESGGHQFPFVKLDCLHEIPWRGPGAYRVGNPGGGEARFVKLEFAKDILKHVDFGYSPEIMHGAFCEFIQLPLMLIPLCTQTSLIESLTSHGENTSPMNWREYIERYCKGKHLDYFDLLKRYSEFLDRKRLLESKFFEVYHRRVDIKKIDYVYRNELLDSELS